MFKSRMQSDHREQPLLINSFFSSFHFYHTWYYRRVIVSKRPGWHPLFSELLCSERSTTISGFCCLLHSSLQSTGDAGGAEKSCWFTKGFPFTKPLLNADLHVDLCSMIIHSACIGILSIFWPCLRAYLYPVISASAYSSINVCMNSQ